jgi:GT2 family glycosyltransferase
VKIAIGCPTAGPPTWKLVESLIGLAPTIGQEGAFLFSRAEMQAPDVARNFLVQKFLEGDCDYLLFVDRDAILHPLTVRRLASWQRDIVGALSFTRYRPPMPTVYRGRHPERPDDYQVRVDDTREWLFKHRILNTSEPALLVPAPADSLAQVDFTGAHCLLVSRRALETIEPPWFQSYYIDPTRLGEDRYFCEKATAAGFKVWVDRSVIAGHMYGEGSLGARDFLVWDSLMDWKKMELRIPPPRREKTEVY